MRQLLMYLLALSSWRTPLLWDWSSVCVWERAELLGVSSSGRARRALWRTTPPPTPVGVGSPETDARVSKLYACDGAVERGGISLHGASSARRSSISGEWI